MRKIEKSTFLWLFGIEAQSYYMCVQRYGKAFKLINFVSIHNTHTKKKVTFAVKLQAIIS